MVNGFIEVVEGEILRVNYLSGRLTLTRDGYLEVDNLDLRLAAMLFASHLLHLNAQIAFLAEVYEPGENLGESVTVRSAEIRADPPVLTLTGEWDAEAEDWLRLVVYVMRYAIEEAAGL